jgi:Family of unknown function (DUF6353)
VSLKSLTYKVSSKIGRQVAITKYHSPALMFGVGIIGVGTTAVLACRATLKMSDVLEKGEEHLSRVDENVITEEDTEGEVKAAHFGVKLKVAIEIAKIYAPAVIVGVASVGFLTGSHLILRKRNAALTAAYTIVDKSFKEYRARVVADQGVDKDREYRFGVTEKEIVEEGPNGPETKYVKVLGDENTGKSYSDYARIFDETHKAWSDVPNANAFFIQSRQNHANDLLRLNGVVFLNDVYDLLDMERSEAGQIVGWVKDGSGDGYIDFGVWNAGVHSGKEWLIHGHKDGVMLDFNVDGPVHKKLRKV